MASILGTSTAEKLGTLGQIVEPVSAAFSGLAFIALVVTFRLQYDELVLQRQELESQRHAMDRTQSELHRSADADIRACHVELMRLSMEDGDLAEVLAGVPGRALIEADKSNMLTRISSCSTSA